MSTRDEAVEDAIRCGHAHRESYPGASVFWNIGVEIEEDRLGNE